MHILCTLLLHVEEKIIVNTFSCFISITNTKWYSFNIVDYKFKIFLFLLVFGLKIEDH